MKITAADKKLLLKVLWDHWTYVDGLAKSNPRLINVPKAVREKAKTFKLIEKVETL